ncbi:MAG: hypothetical protein WC346_16195 [Methanogenium sp.]|jgi:hypothetical protein
MRSRITLRQLKQQAADTMVNANAALNKSDLTIEEVRNLVGLGVGLVNAAADLIEDLADGVDFEIKVENTGIYWIDSLLKKWGGKIPFTIRMDPRE